MPPHASSPSRSLLVSPARSPSFSRDPLRRDALDPDPLVQFARWFGEADAESGSTPTSMTLATVGTDGAANARVVSLKDVDARGFLFTSRYDGPKAREIEAEPRVTLVFYWPEPGRQVRVTGTAERLPDDESARYFDARPPARQLTLLAHPQSEPVADRTAIADAVAALGRARAEGDALPRPSWGGYVVRPRAVEFWQGQADRLHDRFLYEAGEGRWTLTRLTP